MRGLRSVFIVLICVGCLEPYLPPVNTDSVRALVVDGFIATDGSATIKLTRSISLNNLASYSPPEKGATLTIESSAGEIFSLTEGDSAVYSASGLAVTMGDEYTLHIRTADGREYVSDQVHIYPTPAIDNIYFDIDVTGTVLEVLVDAHDDSPDATGYYLWDCLETYEYHAPLYSGFKMVGQTPVERNPDEILYTCWRDNIIPSVVLSTHSLSENRISGKQVTAIDKGSSRISVRYSILVKQRAISEEEYAFRTQLQKSTEQQGSLFAAIPGRVVSNVHSLTIDGEYVLGYFRAQHVEERRFFIDWSELPEDFRMPHSAEGCQPEETCPVGGQGFACIDVRTLSANSLVTSANTDGRGVILSYNVISNACGDCRMKGGVTTPPPFW